MSRHFEARFRRSTRGFTLIELLVVIAIIGVLIALLLPAVQAAREAARRSQCTNNLKQIALATHNYIDANGVTPAGLQWQWYTPGVNLTSAYGFAPALLPFMEQAPLFNAFNFMTIFYGPTGENATVHGIGSATFWCPSDPTSNRVTTHGWPYPKMAHTSYAGMAGTWTNNTYVLPPAPGFPNGLTHVSYGGVKANMKGIFGAHNNSSIADIRDGTSNTIMFGEHALGFLEELGDPNWPAPDWGWWDSGSYGDTQITSMYPINAHKRQPAYEPPNAWATSWIMAASSFHGGGANFAMADGSVRFIKEAIDTWQIDPATELPVGVTMGLAPPSTSAFWATIYNVAPGAKIGVYQAISTKNGGEAVSSDQF